MLKDNKLYQQVFQVRQLKRLVVCNCNTLKTIEKIYAQLKQRQKLKIFAKIYYLYNEINN